MPKQTIPTKHFGHPCYSVKLWRQAEYICWRTRTIKTRWLSKFPVDKRSISCRLLTSSYCIDMSSRWVWGFRWSLSGPALGSTADFGFRWHRSVTRAVGLLYPVASDLTCSREEATSEQRMKTLLKIHLDFCKKMSFSAAFDDPPWVSDPSSFMLCPICAVMAVTREMTSRYTQQRAKSPTGIWHTSDKLTKLIPLLIPLLITSDTKWILHGSSSPSHCPSCPPSFNSSSSLANR